MAVALRELERRRERRPVLRLVRPPLAPARPPRAVHWLRRLLVGGLAILLLTGVAAGARRGSPDAVGSPSRVDLAVVVPVGGTLWDLADQYAPADADRVSWVAAVAERNALDPGELRPGAVVVVPVEAPGISAAPRDASAR